MQLTVLNTLLKAAVSETISVPSSIHSDFGRAIITISGLSVGVMEKVMEMWVSVAQELAIQGAGQTVGENTGEGGTGASVDGHLCSGLRLQKESLEEKEREEPSLCFSGCKEEKNDHGEPSKGAPASSDQSIPTSSNSSVIGVPHHLGLEGEPNSCSLPSHCSALNSTELISAPMPCPSGTLQLASASSLIQPTTPCTSNTAVSHVPCLPSTVPFCVSPNMTIATTLADSFSPNSAESGSFSRISQQARSAFMPLHTPATLTVPALREQHFASGQGHMFQLEDPRLAQGTAGAGQRTPAEGGEREGISSHILYRNGVDQGVCLVSGGLVSQFTSESTGRDGEVPPLLSMSGARTGVAADASYPPPPDPL